MLRLCAAPFLKKALWVLRHLNNQDSAMQPSSRNISEVVAVCRSRLVSESHKRDQSIQGNTGGLLFYCGAFCSPRSAAAQSVMAFTLCITPHVFFFSTSFIIPKEPIHLISSSTLSFDLKSQAATQSGVDCGCFLRAHGSQPEANQRQRQLTQQTMLKSKNEVGKKTREQESNSRMLTWIRPFFQPPSLHSSQQQKKLVQSFPSRHSYRQLSSQSCQNRELPMGIMGRGV